MKARLTKAPLGMSALFVAALLILSFTRHVAAADYDPPDRAARLSYVRGSVSFQPAGESDWGPALTNRPITTADRLWADDGGRVEMQLGSATIRLNTLTGMSFLNLDDQTTQIELTEGTLNIRVLRLDRNDIFEVDTPNLAFSILRPGQYRIQASEDGNSTMVTVRTGEGEVTGGGRIYRVGSGQSGEFTGTDSINGTTFRAGGYDEFDTWSQTRDRHDDGAPSARYVSPDLVGYQDLDDYGAWRTDPNYGNVWIPRVAAGWAPYHDGHWVWISPWGWTWVDEAPWGYAPFHYGRWIHAGNNWGWVPGPISVRPVYAPALVAFIGGDHFGVSISIGGGRRPDNNVGWFPLGPREVYVPAYQTSREYVNRVNVSNTTVNNITITNVYNSRDNGNGKVKYANRTVRGGVTAVSHTTFTNGQSVGRAAIATNSQDIESAPIVRRAEVAPTRDSVFGGSTARGNRVPQPSPKKAQRAVVVKTAPPPAPVPFEKQQRKLDAQPGQPLARNEVENLRTVISPTARPTRQAPPGKAATAETRQGDRPATVIPANPARQSAEPANSGARQDRPNGANSRQPIERANPNPPPVNERAAPPQRNDAPPSRADRPNGANSRQPIDKLSPNPPPVNERAVPPARDDAPPSRADRPNGANNRQPIERANPNPPPVSERAAPPARNDAPATRADRPNGANSRQPIERANPNPPPVSERAAPPQRDDTPPSRADRPNGANRQQPESAPTTPDSPKAKKPPAPTSKKDNPQPPPDRKAKAKQPDEKDQPTQP